METMVSYKTMTPMRMTINIMELQSPSNLYVTTLKLFFGDKDDNDNGTIIRADENHHKDSCTHSRTKVAIISPRYRNDHQPYQPYQLHGDTASP